MTILSPLSALRPQAATQDEFRAAMRDLAGGVSLVTAGTGASRRGFTATSVSSLSLDPPSLLVCINRASSAMPMLRERGAFGVSILNADQSGLADRFAGRGGVTGAARFAGADWLTLTTGAPLLADALTGIDCIVEKIVPWHSHFVVIGAVQAIRLQAGGAPLVYWRGGFRRLDAAQ